jgi:3-oxoacyl-[acyl-carrier-protein] synthase-1
MSGACITGMGLACALGTDPDRSARALHHRKIPACPLLLNELAEPLTLPFCRIADGGELFDATRFERVLTPVVRQAVAEAGLSQTEIRALPVFTGSSCFSVGQSESVYAEALRTDPGHAIPMPVCNYQRVAEGVQRALGCAGDLYAYNTACTSSANALLHAARMLDLGWYAHALVVGAELANRTTLAGFAGLQLIAHVMRPFDAQRSGLVLGEAISAVVLSRRAPDARALRLVGGASNCDTSSVTTANPDGHSVASVLHEALRRTRVQPRQICGIKAHGTATPAGDSAEALGLRAAFPEPPPLTALKPYLGHTLGACGVTELVLYAAALRAGFQPASAGFETPDPVLGLQPLTREAQAPPGHYLLNQFGFGGNNTVLVLEKTAA